jgi:hypothetical protein
MHAVIREARLEHLTFCHRRPKVDDRNAHMRDLAVETTDPPDVEQAGAFKAGVSDGCDVHRDNMRTSSLRQSNDIMICRNKFGRVGGITKMRVVDAAAMTTNWGLLPDSSNFATPSIFSTGMPAIPALSVSFPHRLWIAASSTMLSPITMTG